MPRGWGENTGQIFLSHLPGSLHSSLDAGTRDLRLKELSGKLWMVFLNQFYRHITLLLNFSSSLFYSVKLPLPSILRFMIL